mmetsp:Transcript_93940/g.176558  ORF Transcript_93940/g.176558 Transcript_93940/m.176558 type:complete len:238 (+) Transcript_93940:2222-2935(+)
MVSSATACPTSSRETGSVTWQLSPSAARKAEAVSSQTQARANSTGVPGCMGWSGVAGVPGCVSCIGVPSVASLPTPLRAGDLIAPVPAVAPDLWPLLRSAVAPVSPAGSFWRAACCNKTGGGVLSTDSDGELHSGGIGGSGSADATSAKSNLGIGAAALLVKPPTSRTSRPALPRLGGVAPCMATMSRASAAPCKAAVAAATAAAGSVMAADTSEPPLARCGARWLTPASARCASST